MIPQQTAASTHVKQAEVIKADRNKIEFLATLAHELRHPLAPLRNGLHLLRMESGNPETVRIVEMMDRQVSQMARLIDELLDMARITSGKLALKRELVAVKSVISSAIETSMPLIEARRHALVLHIPDEALLLDADPARLAQVFTNLLNNAAKYTPTGGRIEILARREGPQAVISVIDNGVGIPGESLSAVFDLFRQVAQNMAWGQGGLGIGLALVRELVESHGGTVTASSLGTGHGSTFTMRLPLAVSSQKNASAAAVPPDDALAVMLKGMRVLVVDDHDDSAQSLAAVLELKEHVVAVANEGWQAVQIASQFKPHTAFLDIDMPGMNGYETAQALREVAGLEKLVLVALTGWDDKKCRDRSKTAGFDHHLTKPVQLTAIDELFSGLARPERERAPEILTLQ